MFRFDDPVKEEIWATVRALNDAWTVGNPDDLTRYFHSGMIAITPIGRERIDGGEVCVAAWKGFVNAVTKIHYWRELDPVIRVYGDAAVVSYYFDMSYDADGRTVRSEGRDLFFLVRESGRWRAVADEFSPYPV